MSLLHTPAPWRFELNEKSRQIQLCGGDPKQGFGRYDLIVLDFIRWGFNGATLRLRKPMREHLQIMVPAREYGVAQPGREHHEHWFKLICHPDARLIEMAPEMFAALSAVVAEGGSAESVALAARVLASSVVNGELAA